MDPFSLNSPLNPAWKALAVLALLVTTASLSATESPAPAKMRHAVPSVEAAPASTAAPETGAVMETEASEKTAKDRQRMTTHIGDVQPIAFQEFYPFPEPAAAASQRKSRKALYWIGATGAAVAAGVAAYFIFSEEEPESQPTYLIVQ